MVTEQAHRLRSCKEPRAIWNVLLYNPIN